jgi:type I restriction enzyme, S subunit
MGCFRTDSRLAHPTFVTYAFQTEQYRSCISNLRVGSSINNLKPSDIESLAFAFPGLREQAAIAAVLSDMDAELAALEARLAKIRLLQRLV